MGKFTESTLIPVSLVGVLVSTLVGGVVWLTNIHAKASMAEQKLTQLEQAIIDIAEMKKDIEYIKKSLDRERP